MLSRKDYDSIKDYSKALADALIEEKIDLVSISVDQHGADQRHKANTDHFLDTKAVKQCAKE